MCGTGGGPTGVKEWPWCPILALMPHLQLASKCGLGESSREYMLSGLEVVIVIRGANRLLATVVAKTENMLESETM